jgi:hypothetical protein
VGRRRQLPERAHRRSVGVALAASNHLLRSVVGAPRTRSRPAARASAQRGVPRHRCVAHGLLPSGGRLRCRRVPFVVVDLSAPRRACQCGARLLRDRWGRVGLLDGVGDSRVRVDEPVGGRPGRVHLSRHPAGDSDEPVRSGGRRRSRPAVALHRDHVASRDAGNSHQSHPGHDRTFPDLHRGLRRIPRWSRQRKPLLRALPLPQRVQVFPNGIRVRARLDPVRHPSCPHVARVPFQPAVGPLRRRAGAFSAPAPPAAAPARPPPSSRSRARRSCWSL